MTDPKIMEAINEILFYESAGNFTEDIHGLFENLL
jgi:hypothetical protein